MPSAAPRVQTSNGPRPVGPTHVYPSSSQMMMISQQQLPFAGSPQGYFLPGQVGSQGGAHLSFLPFFICGPLQQADVVSGSLCVQYRAPFMPPTQQYPVASGTAGFYPGTSPAEYPPYGEQPPPSKAAVMEQCLLKFEVPSHTRCCRGYLMVGVFV